MFTAPRVLAAMAMVSNFLVQFLYKLLRVCLDSTWGKKAAFQTVTDLKKYAARTGVPRVPFCATIE